MSYIRFGTKLPSGKASQSFVIGDGKTIINLGYSGKKPQSPIAYVELISLLKEKDFDELKLILADRLGLKTEEAEYVCRGLWEEKEKGEWDCLFGS